MNLLAFYGFITVISLSGVMSPGPLTAFLIARGKQSPWAGIRVTLGHALAEVPLIIALYAGLQPFFEIQGIREGVSLLGGGVLIYLGSGVFRSFRPAAPEQKSVLECNSITGGVLLTLLNPYWILWWLTIGARPHRPDERIRVAGRSGGDDRRSPAGRRGVGRLRHMVVEPGEPHDR